MRAPKTSKEAMQFFALRLRNADPEAFDGFYNALDTYGVEALNEMAHAPQTEVLQMQGRCKQLQALLQLLRECPNITATLDPPQRNQPPDMTAAINAALGR